MSEKLPDIGLIYKNMATIWLGLFTGQVMFAVVAFVAKPELLKLDFSKPVFDENGMIIGIFALLSATMIVAAFVLRSTFNKRAVDEQSPGLVQTGMIISCALCEGVSILGMLLAFIYSYQYFFFFIAAAMAAMAFQFPTRASLINASFARKL